MVPFAMAVLAALFFGAATPLSKSLLGTLSSFQLAGLLYLGAALGVLPLVLAESGLQFPWRLDRSTGQRLGGAVLFGGMLGPVLLLSGLRLAPAASVSLWLNLELVFTVLLGLVIFKDTLGRWGWFGAGLALLGAAMISMQGGQAGWMAGGLVAAACLCWGLDNHLTALIDGITPAQSTLWKSLAAGTANLVLGLVFSRYQAGLLETLTAGMIGVVAYGLSLVLYISAAQRVGATRSQLAFSSAPFFGALLSVVMLGETLSLPQVLAGLLSLAGMFLLSRDEHHHVHVHAAGEHLHWHSHPEAHHEHHPPGEASRLHHHRHSHMPLEHSHPHYPDLHHRHPDQPYAKSDREEEA